MHQWETLSPQELIFEAGALTKILRAYQYQQDPSNEQMKPDAKY